MKELSTATDLFSSTIAENPDLDHTAGSTDVPPDSSTVDTFNKLLQDPNILNEQTPLSCNANLLVPTHSKSIRSTPINHHNTSTIDNSPEQKTASKVLPAANELVHASSQKATHNLPSPSITSSTTDKGLPLPSTITAHNSQNYSQKITTSDTDSIQNIQAVPVPIQTQGDKILHNLQMLSNASTVRSSEASPLINAIQEELVNQILVSTNALDHKQNVKIIFNPQLLPNTEVNLLKQGQQLNITFVSHHPQTENFLINTQANLQAYLTDKLQNFQTISVNVRAQENNSQPHDGHSRNRYEYQAAEDDE